MIRKEFLSILSSLELRSKSRSFQEKIGSAESSKRGRGLDFKDVRLYGFGDDTRLIDWNVTSRFGELYVREFYEEKERQAILFYDISSSMEWGSGEYSRAENAFQVLALISLLYVQKGNRVKIVLYCDRVEWETDFLRSRDELLPVLRKISDKKLVPRRSDPLFPFRYLKNRVHRHADVFLLSDFIGISNLRKYSGLKKHYSLRAVRFRDPLEMDPPKSLLSFFYTRDPEESGGGLLGRTLSPEFELKSLRSFFQSSLLDLTERELKTEELIRYFSK
ncbi:DUF58 domain-containing protein [Leptospira santarosai]|uniref:DUF58 domain-containing protein n=3 Tax=Leptospira santarosai TaxID=28183 RepID=K8Y278_9LEPT|nr:DUF58 domain-containing protein [Leptospira santarosai]EKO31755.1 PF01882 family protein [Leptospira santarosai str. MOR084]EKR91016.1 PF01882 family protein [Leptospira santarosai str. CBC379]EKS07714.1 PF01882 family protein [Leptospira santarosai str. JET]EKT87116.1 hypothetical protein LSS_08394 [Leptospira santarosai serovar Shermani str. LT 821]EMM77795.1 PF01882 family protein [Leptospira santarosai str. 2000030832]